MARSTRYDPQSISLSRVSFWREGSRLPWWAQWLLTSIGHLLIACLVAIVGQPFLALLYLGLMSIIASWRRRRRRQERGLPARLKFTREGKSVVAIALGVGIAAINTGNNMLYLFLGMMLSLIIISGILSEITMRRLSVSRRFPEQIFAEQPVLVSLTLRNQKRLVPSYGIQVADHSSAQEKSKRCFFLKVGAQDEQVTNYRLEFSHRGHYQFERMTIITRFPFAFFVKQRSIASKAGVIVFPSIFPVDLERVFSNTGLGHLSADEPGQGRDFHALDEYRMGHNARDIHWRRSASAPYLVRREYATEDAPSTTIFLNNVYPETAVEDVDLERLVSAAASLLMAFHAEGKKCTLASRQAVIPVELAGDGLHKALTHLATLAFEPPNESTANQPYPYEQHCLVLTLPGTKSTLPPELHGSIWTGDT